MECFAMHQKHRAKYVRMACDDDNLYSERTHVKSIVFAFPFLSKSKDRPRVDCPTCVTVYGEFLPGNPRRKPSASDVAIVVRLRSRVPSVVIASFPSIRAYSPVWSIRSAPLVHGYVMLLLSSRPWDSRQSLAVHGNLRPIPRSPAATPYDSLRFAVTPLLARSSSPTSGISISNGG